MIWYARAVYLLSRYIVIRELISIMLNSQDAVAPPPGKRSAGFSITYSWQLFAYKHKFVVVVPTILLGVHSGLELRRAAGRAAAAAGRQLEPLLLQHVERLLDERVLEEEPGRVPVGQAVVRVPRLVQRLSEHVPAQRHFPAHQNPGQLAELHVGEAVAAERETAAVSHGDAALLAVRRARVRVPNRALQAGQTVVPGLTRQALVLAEALGQHEAAVAEVVEHVSEEHAVAVEEDAPAGVARVVWVAQRGGRQRVGLAQQRVARGGVVHAADVQLEHLGRGVRHGWRASAQCRATARPSDPLCEARAARTLASPPSITHARVTDSDVIISYPFEPNSSRDPSRSTAIIS